MWTRASRERWLQTILHIHDTPDRSAAAVALGIAIGFSPFVGFHTIIGLTLAFMFNLNRVAVVAGTWVNLPWFMGPYYAAATAGGAWLTGTEMPPHLLADLESIWALATWRGRVEALGHLLKPFLAPFLVGSLIGALLIGVISYRITLTLLHARAQRLHSDRVP
jgi:uncharacterized protein